MNGNAQIEQVSTLLQLPVFPKRAIDWLPYYVVLNSKEYRVLYQVSKPFKIPAWYDWFTGEPIPMGSWIWGAEKGLYSE